MGEGEEDAHSTGRLVWGGLIKREVGDFQSNSELFPLASKVEENELEKSGRKHKINRAFVASWWEGQ